MVTIRIRSRVNGVYSTCVNSMVNVTIYAAEFKFTRSISVFLITNIYKYFLLIIFYKTQINYQQESGCVRTAYDSLLTTSVSQVVNRLVAS